MASDHYSYTQLSTYLQCPLKYKYHYLDGWQERDDKASLVFGRLFQMAVESQFLVSDSVRFFTERWTEVKDLKLEYGNSDSWEKMLDQGQQLLNQFREDQRVLIDDGRTDFQVKFRRPLSLSQRHFLAYVDAIGWVDGIHCLIEWKTTTQAYPESLLRVFELDPQLVLCQGRNKTRPEGRSKNRPLLTVEEFGLSGSAGVAGAEACAAVRRRV